METKPSVEQSIAAYRLAGRTLAREQNQCTATVVFAGVSAEYLHRQEVGATVMDTYAETLLEVICGDVLVTQAVQAIGGIATIRVTNWVATNWKLVQEYAERILLTQQLLDEGPALTRVELCHATAAVECASVARDSTTAGMAYAGAVAVARARLGDRWYSLSANDRDAYLSEVICGDPVWATAAEELNEAERVSVHGWVYRRWDEITRQAADMAVVDIAMSLVTVDSIAAGARSAMSEWLRRLPDLDQSAVAYGAAAAEGLARWRHRGGAAGDEELIMRGWAATDPAITGSLDTVPVKTRETVVQMVRAMLSDLTPLT